MLKPESAIIIGGGLSGLATAWELQRRGVQVRVLESRDETGGVVRSLRRSGFLVDIGPSEMLVKSAAVEDTLKEIGLESRMQVANPQASKRYIVRRGRPVQVPMSPLGGVFTPLFSLRGKLRLLREFRVPKGRSEDESVASFVRRRVGADFLDYAVNPLVSGIFAGDPEQLSMRHAFPKLWELERRHGGLMRGALALRAETRANGHPSYKRKLVSFEGGMGTLTGTLAAHLGDAVHCGVQVLGAQQTPEGRWKMIWKRGGDVHQMTADSLVLSVPAHAVRTLPLPGDLQRALAALSEVVYSPVSTLYLGYRREQVRHPLDGFGMLVPRRERRRILGTLFMSSLFPGRAPEGHVGLLTFVGGMNAPDKASLPAATMAAIVREELGDLLGVSGEPVLVHHHFWPNAIPQYSLGYQRVLDRLEHAEERFKGLAIVSNFRGGPGAGDCLASARAAAERLVGC